MNLWILSALILGALHLAGLLVLVWGAVGALEGYQDAGGFHLETGPRARPFAGGDPAEQAWEHVA